MKAFHPAVTSIATTVGFLSGGFLSVSIQSGALHVASPWHTVFGHHASLIFTILSAISAVAVLVAGWGRSIADHKKKSSIIPKDEHPRNILISPQARFVPTYEYKITTYGKPPENLPVTHIPISPFFKAPKF